MAGAIGIGIVAGGLIGTGVGVAAGLEVAGAGTAAITTAEAGTAVTTAACADGDCTNEVTILTEEALPAIEQFAKDAYQTNFIQRGYGSLLSNWKGLAMEQERLFSNKLSKIV